MPPSGRTSCAVPTPIDSGLDPTPIDANRLIADPEAVARQYIPATKRVLAYTDIVAPGERQTISLTVPATPGRYPFLCTFPGHWMVMNGELVVR